MTNYDFSKQEFEQLIDKVVEKKYITGAVFNVSSGDDSINIIKASGNINENSQYYIASINKLFISAIILRMYSENRLNINDNISKYLSK